MDSLLVIRVKEIEIDKRAAIDDEYHKAQILKDLDLRLLKAAKEPYGRATEPHDYIKLRDSLIVGEVTFVDLPLDSVTEHLRFWGTRLHGRFARLSKMKKLIIDGRFKNGIEDSVWSFYDAEGRLISRKHFENGELIKTESFEDGNRVSTQKHRTRDDIIRNKYFHLAMIAVLVIALITRLALNYKHSGQEDIIRVSTLNKLAGTMGLPIVVFFLAKSISAFIPNSYDGFFLAGFGEAMMVCIFTLPLFLLILYVVKLRTSFDIVFYILVFSLGIVFVEEWLYLRSILDQTI
jgi:hypothetical protein